MTNLAVAASVCPWKVFFQASLRITSKAKSLEGFS